MKRIMLMATAFLMATSALLWGRGGGEDVISAGADQVSHMVDNVVTPQTDETDTSIAQVVTEDDMSDVMRNMSLGIMRELRKSDLDVPTTEIMPTSVQPDIAPFVPAVRTYDVQEGDSLPGIAFRFYGTTVAYLKILQANEDVLSDPSQLSAGMVLRVPELQ